MSEQINRQHIFGVFGFPPYHQAEWEIYECNQSLAAQWKLDESPKMKIHLMSLCKSAGESSRHIVLDKVNDDI